MLLAQIAIIGAGITGLSIAFKLASQGHNLTIAEKGNRAGGHMLSTNLGDFHTDLGPHIFRSKDERVLTFVKTLLNHSFINMKSDPRIYKYGKIFDNTIPVITRKNIEMLSQIRQIRPRRTTADHSGSNFEEIMINRIGYDLYWEFFGEYSEKWWGLKGSLLDPVLVPKTLYVGDGSTYSHYTVDGGYIEEIYPKTGGFMAIVDALASRVRKQGVKIELGEEVTGLEYKGPQTIVVSRNLGGEEKEIAADLVYYTGPLDAIFSLVKDKFDLDYRGIIFCKILLHGRTEFEKYSWMYIHEKRLLAARVYDAKYYHPHLRNGENTAIVVEIPSNNHDGKWEAADETCDKAFEQLVGEGLVKLSTNSFANDIMNKVIIKDQYSYPRFKINYGKEYNRLVKSVSESLPNLRLEGRYAGFQYLNSNSIIEKYVFSDYLQSSCR